MRGRTPKPTHLKVIAGNPGKRPLNAQEAHPASGATPPDPPAHFTGEARAEWLRLAPELHRVGLLSNVDHNVLAAYCQCYARWRQAESALATMALSDPMSGALLIKTANGTLIQNPLVGTANKALASMLRFASEFGMTPASRSRIAADGGSNDEGPLQTLFG